MNGALWINYHEQGTFMHYLKAFITWLLNGGHWKIQSPEIPKMLEEETNGFKEHKEHAKHLLQLSQIIPLRSI
jgi:hypothetical protein